MTEDKNNPADGPGEAVIDEPTEHALDPAKDPNNEWEAKAAEQIAEGGDADEEPKKDESDS